MSDRLDGQVTLVTGAASGIGKGIVRRFVAEAASCVSSTSRTSPDSNSHTSWVPTWRTHMPMRRWRTTSRELWNSPSNFFGRQTS